MIFGKYDKSKKDEEQKDIMNKINGIERFLWLPEKLIDGRWCWLQKVVSYYHGGFYKKTGTKFLWSRSPDSLSYVYENSLVRDDNLKRLTEI